MGLFGISTNCPSFGLDLGRGHAGNCKGRKRKCFFHEGRKEQLPFVFSSRSTLEKALLPISFSQSFHPGHKPQTKLYCCRYTSHWGITSQLALDKGFHELNTSEILKTEGAEIQIQGWGTWPNFKPIFTTTNTLNMMLFWSDLSIYFLCGSHRTCCLPVCYS